MAHNKLYVTFLKLFGIEENTFGLPDLWGRSRGSCPGWTERAGGRARRHRRRGRVRCVVLACVVFFRRLHGEPDGARLRRGDRQLNCSTPASSGAGVADGAAPRSQRRLRQADDADDGAVQEVFADGDCEAANARDRLYYVRLPPRLRSGQGVSHRLPRSRVRPAAGLVGTTQGLPDGVGVRPRRDPDRDGAGLLQQGRIQQPSCVDPTTRRGPRAATCATTASMTARVRPRPDSAEYGYFDRLHKQIESDFCVDTDQQFYAGYSSGGWMAHQLGCQFPDVLRAQASVTGGLPPVIRDGTKTCVNHPIAAFLIHDAADPSNPYSGSVAALERLLALNKCAGGDDDAGGALRALHDHRVAEQSDLQLRQLHRLPARVPGRVLHVARQDARFAGRGRRPRLLAVLQGPLSVRPRSPSPREAGRGSGEGPSHTGRRATNANTPASTRMSPAPGAPAGAPASRRRGSALSRRSWPTHRLR